MVTLQKISFQEIIDLTEADFYLSLQDHEKSEMAIPSYLHPNPAVRWLMWKRYDVIAGWLELNPNSKVLEFGCGTGVFLPTLCSHGSVVYAMDLALSIAKKIVNKHNLQVNFVEEIDEIEDNSLDFIIAADVLEHIQNVETTIEKLKNKLKNGGGFYVSGPTENQVYKVLRHLVGFEGKSDYHVSNIDLLIPKIIHAGFTGRRRMVLPFSKGQALFRLVEFIKSS